jgi:hypothetical protein
MYPTCDAWEPWVSVGGQAHGDMSSWMWTACMVSLVSWYADLVCVHALL